MRGVRGAWAVAVLALACIPMPARAAVSPWHEVFAQVRDTVVFIAADGALVRAPFHMATRETLWTPSGGGHLVRASASPDGRRVAWIARGFDSDTTRLWTYGPEGVGLRLSYFALQARRHGFVHTAPDVPTVEDRNTRGPRFIAPGARMRRNASNTLAWSSDGRTVLVGYDGGIAAVPAAGGTNAGLDDFGLVSLESLHPAPMFEADVIQLDGAEARKPIDQLDLERLFWMNPMKRSPGRADYVLTIAPGGWHVYPVEGLARARARAAGPRTVWWGEGRVVRAVRAGDPGVTYEFTAGDRIVWLGFDAARGALMWASERRVGRRSEDGSDTVRLETSAPIRAAIESATGGRIAFVTDDSLLIWNPVDDAVVGAGRAGTRPCALFETPDGAVLVASHCDSRDPVRLARLDPGTGTLTRIEVPRMRRGDFRAVAGGAWLLLYDPSPKPPRVFQAYDTARGAWIEVQNPGLSGWERLGTPD